MPAVTPLPGDNRTMYDVSKFDVKTTFVYNTIPITYSYEYGDGWAQQWTDFGFSAKVW